MKKQGKRWVGEKEWKRQQKNVGIKVVPAVAMTTAPKTIGTATAAPSEESETEEETEAPSYGPGGTYKTLDEAFAAYLKTRTRPLPAALRPKIKAKFAQIYKWVKTQ